MIKRLWKDPFLIAESLGNDAFKTLENVLIFKKKGLRMPSIEELRVLLQENGQVFVDQNVEKSEK
jgi:hypothetical protein